MLIIFLVVLFATKCELRSSHETAANRHFSERIIGGTYVSENSTHNFHVSLFNRKHRHYCGGAIIRQNWVISSAHCHNVCGKNLMCAVRYGTIKLRNGRISPIRLLIVHEKYKDFPSIGFDISLIEAPLILDETAQPIPIYSEHLEIGTKMEVEGWGWTQAKTGTCSKVIKAAVVKLEHCPSSLPNSFMCAVGNDSNPCHGDSGGSLIYNDSLVGLVGSAIRHINDNDQALSRSYKIKPRCKLAVTVTYTNVLMFRDWVSATIKYYTKTYRNNLNEEVHWNQSLVENFYKSLNPNLEC